MRAIGNRKLFVFFLFIATLTALPNRVSAEYREPGQTSIDNNKYKMKFFQDIERVYVYVQHGNQLDYLENGTFFTLKNIQKTILDAYTKSFSAERCEKFIKKYSQYSGECSDKKVTLIDDPNSFKPNSNSYNPLLDDPGTLNVVLSVMLVKERKSFVFNPPLASPIIVFTMFTYRGKHEGLNSHAGFPPIWRTTYTNAYPLNLSNEDLKTLFTGFVEKSVEYNF